MVTFRESLEKHFRRPIRSNRPKSTEKSEAILRQEINSSLEEVRNIVAASGVPFVYEWTPPPAIGGYVQTIDLFHNIFGLDQFQIDVQRVLDVIDRSLGIYKSNSRSSLLKTLNPFWWTGRLLIWFARVPFRLLHVIGFDSTKAEASLPGRILKGVLLILSGMAAFLTILHRMGWLEDFRTFVRW